MELLLRNPLHYKFNHLIHFFFNYCYLPYDYYCRQCTILLLYEEQDNYFRKLNQTGMNSVKLL